MRMLSRLAFVLPLALVSAGCFTSETVIKIKADGSGTIEQAMLMNPKAMEQMAGMLTQQMGGEVKTKEKGSLAPKDMLDKARLEESAKKLGKGVRFVSAEPLTRGEMQGGKVVYAFDDVNALTIDQNMSPVGEEKRREDVAFKLTKLANGDSLLTVSMPDNDRKLGKAGDKPAGPGEIPPPMMEMVKKMFDGMRISIAVDVVGTLVKSSSPHVAGQRVTILEMDMGELMKQADTMNKLQALQPGASVGEMREALKQVKGVKINESPVTIEFK